MCGIAGFYGFNNKALIRRMCNSIAHRGPDDKGYYEGDNITLGHRRLSIIDLSKSGRQPMSNEDGTVWVTYNGEIYNFQSLRKELEGKHTFSSKTDTEVIVHAYEEWGIDCVKRFRGMFAFGLWDDKKKILFLARDRLGIKPLYYYHHKNTLIFASEIKAIMEADIQKEVNWNSVHSYLTFRFTPGEDTIFKNIKRLPPGHCILFKKDIQFNKYWDLELKEIRFDEKDAMEKVSEISLESVKDRLMSDVPLGVFLSGGIDSSAIVGMMSKTSDSRIKTFSIGFGDPNFDELEYAQSVADTYNTDHRSFIVKEDIIKTFPKIVWHFDEPIADPALFPTYVLADKAKKYIKVVLTGEGGDEIFGGYEHYKILSLTKNMKFVPRHLRMILPMIARKSPPSLLNKIFRYSSSLGEEAFRRFSDLLNNVNDLGSSYLSLVSIFDEMEKNNLYTKETRKNISLDIKSSVSQSLPQSNILNAVSHYEIKTALVNHLLMKVDKMTMAHSIEARVPLLDHRLVELGLSLPSKLRLNGTRDKYIFRKAMRPMLPEKIFKRSKQRFFVPIDSWLEKDLDWLSSGLLSESSIRRRGCLKYEPVRKIFEKFDRSRLYYSRQLWSLLSLEIWFRLYKDGIKESKVLESL